MERMGMRIHELIQDRAYVSVGVLDRVETKGAVGRDGFFQIGCDELCEPGRAEERAFIETVSEQSANPSSPPWLRRTSARRSACSTRLLASAWSDSASSVIR